MNALLQDASAARARSSVLRCAFWKMRSTGGRGPATGTGTVTGRWQKPMVQVVAQVTALSKDRVIW
jgi:hypothetical protein